MPDRLLSLFAEQALAPVPGGTGRYTREVAAALAGAVPPHWQLRLLTAWHRDLSAAAVPGTGRPDRLPAGRRVLTALWEQRLPPLPRSQVLHATTPLAPLALRPRAVANRWLGAVVVTVHDVVPYTHPQTLTPRGADWHRRMIERAGRVADAIVVPTTAVAAALAQHTGIAGDRVRTIGEGVSEVFRQRARGAAVDAVRARFGLPERYLVTVGTLEPRKGLDVLLAALQAIDPRVGLAVVGPAGWGEGAMPSQVSRLGLADRVRFLGAICDADLVAVLSGAQLSVTPSLAEGFGLPLVEAMALGVPAVHSALPVLIEVSGGAAVAVPPGEPAALAAAVQRLLDDPAAAAAVARAGRLAVRRHSWPQVAASLWTLYREIAG